MSRLARLALATGAAAVGGGLVFYSYRPRNIPGFEAAAVPPPIYGADGTFKLPRFPRIRPREEQLAALAASRAEPYDVLVIGGGATGAGVALDAATRGLRVAVVERDDFSSGTSSKSTKLVHGGVRYLEKAVWNLDYAQYQLVREALKERKYFLQTAPHLSMWLPIMLPLDRWWKAPYYWAGTKLYDVLAGSEGIESSYFLTRSKAIDAFPMLKRTDLVGALVYYDGAHNDSRMNVSLAMTAALYGATVVNHVEVTALTKDDSGRLCGATARDLVPERDGRRPVDIDIRARCVVNCTGPFTDGVRKLDDPSCDEIVSPASGVHIILPGYYSPRQDGPDRPVHVRRPRHLLPAVAGQHRRRHHRRAVDHLAEPAARREVHPVDPQRDPPLPVARHQRAPRRRACRLVRPAAASQGPQGQEHRVPGAQPPRRHLELRPSHVCRRQVDHLSPDGRGVRRRRGQGVRPAHQAHGRRAARERHRRRRRRRHPRRLVPDPPRAAPRRPRLQPDPVYPSHPALRPRDRGGQAPHRELRRPRLDRRRPVPAHRQALPPPAASASPCCIRLSTARCATPCGTSTPRPPSTCWRGGRGSPS